VTIISIKLAKIAQANDELHLRTTAREARLKASLNISLNFAMSIAQFSPLMYHRL